MRCGGSARPERPERRPHPLPALAHRLVGQADHGEGELARRHQHLHVDRQDVDALESDRPNLCLHVLSAYLGENNYRTSYS